MNSEFSTNDIKNLSQLLFDETSETSQNGLIKLKVNSWSEFNNKLRQQGNQTDYKKRALYGVYLNIIDIFHDFSNHRTKLTNTENHDKYIEECIFLTNEYLFNNSDDLTNNNKITIKYSNKKDDNVNKNIPDTNKNIASNPEEYFYYYYSKIFSNLMRPVESILSLHENFTYNNPIEIRKGIFEPTDYVKGRNYFISLPYKSNDYLINNSDDPITDEDNDYINFTRKQIDNLRDKQQIKEGINDSTGIENSFLFGKIEKKNGTGYNVPNDTNLPTNLISFPTYIDNASLHKIGKENGKEHTEEDISKEFGITKEEYKNDLSFSEIQLPLYEFEDKDKDKIYSIYSLYT